MGTRGLLASPGGNGCGVALVPMDPAGGRILQVTVVPKFWRDGSRRPLRVDLADDIWRARPGGMRIAKIVVHELQPLILDGDEADLLLAMSGLTGLAFEVEEADEEAVDEASEEIDSDGSQRKRVPLFKDLSGSELHQADRDTGGGEHATSLAAESLMTALWLLVESADALDLVRPPAPEKHEGATTYLSRSLFAHLPELRPLVLRQFVKTTEQVVKRRKPRFRSETDELGAIRGRIEVRALPRRSSRRSLSIRCSFDELDPDTPWQRLVRAALRVAEGELRATASSRAGWDRRIRSVDQHMADVSLLPPRRALLDIAHRGAPRSERALKEAIALARGVIVGAYPFGTEEYAGDMSVGVAVGLRVSSAALFERLLLGVPLAGERTIDSGERLAILVRSGPSKRPDLIVRGSGGPQFILDAKYKRRYRQMPFADAYQQYAYASASGLSAGFVYVDPAGSRPTAARVIQRGSPANLAVGVGGVAFPEPMQDLAVWRHGTGGQIGDLLEALSAAAAGNGE